MIRRRLTLTLFHSSLAFRMFGGPRTPYCVTGCLGKLPVQRYQSVYDESFLQTFEGILADCCRPAQEPGFHKGPDRGINMAPIGQMTAREPVEHA